MAVREKLLAVQAELKAPKGQTNSFGKYKYRSCEDILESVKPLLKKYNATLVISDSLELIGERYYIKATATFQDVETDGIIENTAYARESAEKKGMDDSQITGTASSYARKYALNGLFLLDDTKDADTDEYHEQTHGKKSEADNTEAFDKSCDEIGNMKIAKMKVDIIRSKCKECGTDEASVLNRYGLNSMEDMTEKQFMSAMNIFAKMEKK